MFDNIRREVGDGLTILFWRLDDVPLHVRFNRKLWKSVWIVNIGLYYRLIRRIFGFWPLHASDCYTVNNAYYYLIEAYDGNVEDNSDVLYLKAVRLKKIS